jgi:hypothetical protein
MTPAPKRRWLQFSLRSLLVSTAVVAVGVAATLHHFRARRAAIRAIDELGGGYGVELKGPAWLRELVGDDKYFYEAHRISLGRPDSTYKAERPFNDKELAGIIDHINVFTGAKTLDLMGSPVTDDGLRCLSRIRDLEVLRLDSTAVTDAGLVHLEPLVSLKAIHLTGTKATEQGIAKLQHCLPNCTIDYRVQKR